MDTRMKLLFAGWLLVISWAGDVMGSGSGRAFPIDSENYVIKQFQTINPKLEWDATNFLVDLSGRYANCKYIGQRGPIQVKETTPTGASIIGYHDYTSGRGSDVNSVNGYIQDTVDKWMKSSTVHSQIRSADTFGCSVRPGCDGQVSISCMFGDEGPSNIIEEPIPDEPMPESPRALAFTPQQYYLAEEVTGNKWDRSHFLENLSGFETDCAMIGHKYWPFTRLNQLPSGLRGTGDFGYAYNKGSTQDALLQILKNIKGLKYATTVGCSLIPDCVIGRDMYVVVSCLYVEQ